MPHRTKKLDLQLAPRVRLLRESLDLTQEELAAKLDVRHATISFWENARAIPTTGYLHALAHLTSDPERTFSWLKQGGQQPRFNALNTQAASITAGSSPARTVRRAIEPIVIEVANALMACAQREKRCNRDDCLTLAQRLLQGLQRTGGPNHQPTEPPAG